MVIGRLHLLLRKKANSLKHFMTLVNYVTMYWYTRMANSVFCVILIVISFYTLFFSCSFRNGIINLSIYHRPGQRGCKRLRSLDSSIKPERLCLSKHLWRFIPLLFSNDINFTSLWWRLSNNVLGLKNDFGKLCLRIACTWLRIPWIRS